MDLGESVPIAGFDQPRDFIELFASALNAKDAESLGKLSSEDAEFVNVRGTRMRGRSGIIEGHAMGFSGPLAGSTFEFHSISELPITDDVTVLHAHSIRDRLPGAPPSTGPRVSTVLQIVVRRGSDGWQAVAAANVPDTPPAVPS
jgi:uncharacterized protein (TIGR02246 family)